MHTHTAPCSRCGVTTPGQLAEALRNGGYSGAVLTNHFYGGNTGISRALSWDEFVKQYELDYLACREAAKEYDLDIIFGVEEHISGGLELLVYGITPDVLYAHPEMKIRDFELWHDVITSHGGIVIQAHPYRERAYIAEPKVLPREWIDGIEVYNAGNLTLMNERAKMYAEANPDLILTSGADTHTPDSVCYAGIECNERIRDGAELVRVLKSGDYNLLK